MENVLSQLSQRLYTLRTSYHLPVSEEEWICGASRSALNNWERGLRIPSADGLYQISTSFGVSIDWLFGVSQIPYTHDSVFLAESIHKPYEVIKDLNQNGSMYLRIDTSSKDYFDNSKRDLYDLAARANILVFALYIQGYNDFFAEHNLRKATEQQIMRLDIVKNGLYFALKTKYPYINILEDL
ncbi:helix-turn-helix domain-containing protein [Succiniclasticum ruminis]|uniref:Transcriptional regulator, contains XRE-family HTH domain n=1 Tax=Succiniclasticum ruminis DSM 9236 TaxID=1123323 RepID=A0A1I2D4V6_9FIRM|nr:helix-turn-helix transcriptional regulator [Succiniclasticum ruminis]SFE75587.1 Transcriptional regulator, contains XRE-family HTH domain [Succiniclasticum ruminis DSM 9236]